MSFVKMSGTLKHESSGGAQGYWLPLRCNRVQDIDAGTGQMLG
jgi:hypothetical protein